MIEKKLNVPVVILHEMDNTQYKISGELISLNESDDTCVIRFKNGRVEKNVPLDVVYINEGLIDTVKKYGKKFAAWIVKKVKGIFLFANPDGEMDVNATAHPLNLVAIQSNGQMPSFVKFWPNENMIEMAEEAGIGAAVIPENVDNCGQAAQEIADINRFWNLVMREAGTTDKSIEESVKYVYENHYHSVVKDDNVLNEAGIMSLRPIVDGIGRKNLNGMVVGTEVLKQFIEASIDGQLKTSLATSLEALDDDIAPEDEEDDWMNDPRFETAKEATKKNYSKTLSQNDNKTKPLLIWGAPGIGKTEIVRQCIHDYRHHPSSPRLLAMYDLNCANLDGDSFRLPKNIDTRSEEEKSVAAKDSTFEQATLSWLPMYTPSDAEYNEKMEKRFELCQHMTADGSTLIDSETGGAMQGGILFLDEIVRARKTGFEALMNICDRKLQEKRLARSWGIICASNRFTDDPNQESDGSLESTPILQRFTVVTYVPSKKEWLDWARSFDESGKAKVEPEIVNFIEAMPDYIWYRTVDFGGYDEELAEIKDDLNIEGEIYEPDGGGVNWEAWQALKDLTDEGKNPLANTMQTWNGRTWHEISEEYREMLRQLLPANIVGKKYSYDTICLKSYIKKDYNGAHPEYVQEALEHVPAEHWKWWCHKYLISNKVAYKDAVSRKLSPAAKMEKVRLALIEIVKKKTASGDSGRDETAPVRMMKDYYSWRKTFEDPTLIESIYNTGYLPKSMEVQDNASPRETEGFKWKNDSGIVEEVNKFILSEYPGGKSAAADDFMQYAEMMGTIIPKLKNELSVIGVKKINAATQEKIENIIENSVGTELKKPSKNAIKEIFTVKTGTDYGDVPTIPFDKYNPAVLKVIFHFYNTFDFFKYMVNYTKYRIKIDFTRNTFNMVGGFMNGNDYRDELVKQLGLAGNEEVKKAITNIEQGISYIVGTGKSGGESLNIQGNDTISNIMFINIFKLLRVMLIESNTYQQSARQLAKVDRR